MDKHELTFLDLLLEAHIDLDRQGPGSKASMKQALSFLGDPSKFKRAADLGCGSGGQTLELAKHIPAHITALDLFPQFIEKLRQRAESEGLASRITGVTGNMESLPFEKGSFDLIWCEGAIDNIGFEKGLAHWHDFLKKGGYVAVTNPSWLTDKRPDEVERFWTEAGSHIDTVRKNIEILQDAGYEFVAAFALPDECWTENYFAPRARALSALEKKYAGNEVMHAYMEVNRREAELFSAYHQHYGYVFYIGRAM